MTKNEAKAILDKVREGTGFGFGLAEIRAALHVTGDLGVDEAMRGQRLDSPLSRAGGEARGASCPRLVVQDVRTDCVYPWSRWNRGSQEAYE